MHVFRVDFNEQDEYGHVAARSDQVGDVVAMLDYDGNYCQGRIVMVRDNGFIEIMPDYATWVDCPGPLAGPVTSDDVQRNDPPRPAPEIYLG